MMLHLPNVFVVKILGIVEEEEENRMEKVLKRQIQNLPSCFS